MCRTNSPSLEPIQRRLSLRPWAWSRSGKSHQTEPTFTSPLFSSPCRPATSAPHRLLALLTESPCRSEPPPPQLRLGSSATAPCTACCHCLQLLLLPYQNSHCPPLSPLQSTQNNLHAKSNWRNGMLKRRWTRWCNMHKQIFGFWVGIKRREGKN